MGMELLRWSRRCELYLQEGIYNCSQDHQKDILKPNSTRIYKPELQSNCKEKDYTPK